MRLAVSLIAIAVLAACSLFTTPCDRVAASICSIPGEASSCTFLRGLRSNNEAAQGLCKGLESSARSYAENKDSVLEKGRWIAARAALTAVGFVGERLADEPGKKLEAAGEKVQEGLEIAGEKVREGVEQAGDALRDAVHDATR